MTPELEDLLIRKYPRILAQRQLPVTASAMGWGCDCREGWWQILDALFEAVAWHADESATAPETAQIKQKLGSLRVYWDGDDDVVQAATWVAEEFSTMICEVTGRPGQMTVRGGFIQVLCPEEAEREGAVPTRRLVSGDGGGAPPTEAERLKHLLDTYGGVIGGPIEVPSGWLSIVEAALRAIMAASSDGLMATSFTERDGELVVALNRSSERGQGIARCAAALAWRTDPITGVLLPPVMVHDP